MLYRHNIHYCFEDRIGARGLSAGSVTSRLAVLAPGFERLKNRRNAGANPLLALPSRTDDLASITAAAEEIRGAFKQVVVAGAGGSGLSGRTLSAMKPEANTPSLHFLETIDPDAIAAMLAGCDVAQTGFIVVSKSGTTVETLAHFYALLSHAQKALGNRARGHFTVITCAHDNPLRQAAMELGCRILDYDSDIGGRFAILTNVGLLPGALAGLDIARLRQGAQSVIDEMDRAHAPESCQAALGATLHMAFLEKNVNSSVMFPYSERLSGLASWWRQSWAESLAKDGKGFTPIRAVGTTDQHSQLQLYLDGPKDKWLHLITLARSGTGQGMAIPDKAELAYLRGKTTGDIMAAEQKATLETLAHNHCPVRVFELDGLAEEQMGALLMHFTLETILTAELLGVNPFDQPAVEESKRLAREYLLKGNL